MVAGALEYVAATEARLLVEIAEEGGPAERLQAIMDRVGTVAEVPAAERDIGSLVRGCATAVYLTGAVREGRLQLAASASSPLVAGLVRLLCEAYDGAPVTEARDVEPTLLEGLGLQRRLTPTRARTLELVRARIRELAS